VVQPITQIVENTSGPYNTVVQIKRFSPM